ncbi:MAG: hypothetical protein NT085_01685 [candidate division SR1 bacterium]|nr:hypothetical protein [candidate division SR1 bacterium]
MNTKDQKIKKPEASSKENAYLDKKIVIGDNTFSKVQHKTKEELAKEMTAKKERKIEREQVQKYGKILFLNLKDSADNSIVANNYLFELIKKYIKGKEAYRGLYKIDVVKKDDQGIACKISGANYTHEMRISNEEIMKEKTTTQIKRVKNEQGERIKQPTEYEDKLEDVFTMSKTYYTPEREKKTKIRPGRKEDFLMEIEYGDSVIIDVQNDNIRKIEPNDIIEEIGTYIKKNDSNDIKSKKIQTAMKFFNESKKRLSSEYIKDFMNKLVKDKEIKWGNVKKGALLSKENKEHFAEVLKKFINQQNLYVHKENDIDKSAVKLLLQKFGIKENNRFNEIDHNDEETFKEGIYFDVLGTTNGMKVIEKEIQIPGGKKIIKRKKIISEHTDTSDEAEFKNRPSSTTQMIFTIAKELGVINKEDFPQIERFVNFVNTVDSMDYQISSIDYKNNYQTIFGLYRTMDIQDVFDYFKNPEHNGFEKLPGWYMKQTKTVSKDNSGKKIEKTLKEISENHYQKIEESIKNFEKIKKGGNVLEYNNTKFIVDIEDKTENQIKYGPQTAGYEGYGFFNIKPERGNIYIYSPKKLPPTIEGFSTESNNHFLIINTPTKDDMKNILEKFDTKDLELKKRILDRLEYIQEKKAEPLNEKDITLRCSKILPEITKKDIKIGRTYTGIINNDVQNKIAYVTLDSKETIKGRIKVEDKNELKKYKKGDIVKVKIQEISEEEGKLLTLSLAA